LHFLGVHGIFHTASPADLACDTFEKMVTPAVRGTENILQSAHAYGGPQLASVVITSSVSAVHNINLPSDRDYTFDESDFAPADLDLLKSNDAAGIQNSIFQLYIASKVASEAFAWSFRTTKKPNFTISTIQPGNVIGPPVQPPKIAAKLNETLKSVWGIFSGSVSELSPVSPSSSYVDVRDVALMHLWAFENGEKADGERFIAVAGAGPTQAIVDILREAYPDRLNVMPEGLPGVGYTGWKDGKVGDVGWVSGRIRISGQKAQTMMGLEWIPIKKSVTDTAKVLEMYL
jgi:nucleoside-diphosphate-sugar epimerase